MFANLWLNFRILRSRWRSIRGEIRAGLDPSVMLLLVTQIADVDGSAEARVRATQDGILDGNGRKREGPRPRTHESAATERPQRNDSSRLGPGTSIEKTSIQVNLLMPPCQVAQDPESQPHSLGSRLLEKIIDSFNRLSPERIGKGARIGAVPICRSWWSRTLA